MTYCRTTRKKIVQAWLGGKSCARIYRDNPDLVPCLRVVEEVVAYYSTLEGAVQLDHHQEVVLAPLELDEREQADLVAFLRTLDGELLKPDLAKNRP